MGKFNVNLTIHHYPNETTRVVAKTSGDGERELEFGEGFKVSKENLCSLIADVLEYKFQDGTFNVMVRKNL